MELPIFLVAALSVTTGCAATLLLVRNRHHSERARRSERINVLQRKIEAVLDDDLGTKALESFTASLKAASLTTDLQRPRLDNLAKIDKQPPEKYRILARLASQGLAADEIAAIVGISHVEVRQLLSLRTMSEISRGPRLAPFSG